MALAKYRAGRDIGGFRFFDRQCHRLGVDMKTKAPVAIDHGRGRRFLHNRPLRAGNDMPDLDAIDIGRDRDYPVRVVTGEIGVDATGSHGVGFLVRSSGRPEQRRANARETVGLHDRHGISSNLSPRRMRVLLLVVGSWSQRGGRRASGKIGNRRCCEQRSCVSDSIKRNSIAPPSPENRRDRSAMSGRRGI